MLKVYTKVGDQGKTKQVTGKMVAKYDPQIQTLGALDELQSWLGVTVANLSPACQGLEEKLIKLEREMYELQADLVVKRHHTITLAEVTYMEEQIDAWTEELPEMKEFILPGGSKTSANLQYARARARTSERVCVLYADESGEVKSDSLKYLNRLSDYLFVMARYANLLEGVADVKSKPARPRRRPKK